MKLQTICYNIWIRNIFDQIDEYNNELIKTQFNRQQLKDYGFRKWIIMHQTGFR